MNEHILICDVPVQLSRLQALKALFFGWHDVVHLRTCIMSTAEQVEVDYISVEQIA